jgi:hypothetical protein
MIDRVEILKTVKACVERGLVSAPPPKTTRTGYVKGGPKPAKDGSLLRQHAANIGRIKVGEVWWVVRAECDGMSFRQLNKHTTHRITYQELLTIVLQGPVQITVEIRQTNP